MLIAPLNLEFQPSIEPNVVVFDVQRRGYTTDLNVNLMNYEGEVMHRVITKVRDRGYFTNRLAGALLQISQAEPEVNDGWVRMDAIFPGNNKLKSVKGGRAVMKNHIKNISDDFGGLLDFRNISKASEFRAVRPFGVAFTLRPKNRA